MTPKKAKGTTRYVAWCPTCKTRVKPQFVSPEGTHTATTSVGYHFRSGSWGAKYRGPCGAKVLKLGTEALQCEGGCWMIVPAGEVNPKLKTETGWRCLGCRPRDDPIVVAYINSLGGNHAP